MTNMHIRDFQQFQKWLGGVVWKGCDMIIIQKKKKTKHTNQQTNKHIS
jgi:hypothetical protein